ncbi:MAG: T9SS type A sorting domain-containing protein [Bacteroidota bacterium]
MQRKLVLSILCIVLMTGFASAQVFLSEQFSYPNGDLLKAHGWSAHSGTGTNAPAVTTPGLTYASFPGSGLGGAALVGALGGEDVNLPFAEQTTNGKSTYFSFLVNVNDTAVNRTGDYFFNSGNRTSPTTFTLFATRVFAKITGGLVNFGISNTSTATYGSTSFAKNTVYLMIVKYTMNTGAGNDSTSLWVIPTGIPASEAAAGTAEAINTTTAGQDTLDAIALRQGSTTQPQVLVDGIRVGGTWADVTTGLVDEVTFKVYMGIKMKEGKFLPASGDTVRVVGSFNGWSASDTTVRMTRNSGSDSLWVLTRAIDGGIVGDDTVYYKFYKTSRGGDWESIADNRVQKLVAGSHSTSIWYFDNDSVANLQVPVTFKVNMAIKMRELTFQPQNSDIVRVAGSFNNWGSSTDTLTKGVSDSIYTSKTITMNEGDAIFYKFLKSIRGGLDWEGSQPTSSTNREFTVPVGGGTVPVVYFDNDNVYNATVQANLLWQSDISAYVTLGWFNPAKDSVEVRGGFNGWAGGANVGRPNALFTNIWEYTTQNQILPIGDQQQYKFYIKADSALAVARFPGLIWGGTNDNRDGFFYEHPAPGGDGNNLYTVTANTNQAPQRNYFSGINPAGLLAATDSVNVTVKVNMGPANRYSNPFSYTADTLWLVWQDAMWRSAQEKNQGSFPATLKMTRQGPSDSVFTVTFKVKGKAHYNMQYTFRYKRADASVVDQGGGLGGQNPFISRFIGKGATWPTTYTVNDTWKKDAPLTGDAAPFTTDVSAPSAPPAAFELAQNYPNPFNPVTTIRYSVAQQGLVHLRVYNLLGQQVAELANEVKAPGTHIVSFDASRFASGVYFYKLEAGSFTDIKKMVLLK